MLPDGFKLAPQERWTEEIKEETEGVYFTNYSEEKDNIIIVGPLPGDTNKEIVFPVLPLTHPPIKNITMENTRYILEAIEVEVKYIQLETRAIMSYSLLPPREL